MNGHYEDDSMPSDDDMPPFDDASGILDRPMIQVTTALHDVVDQAALALRKDPATYQRRGSLVSVVRIPSTEADAARLEGAPEIRLLALPTLRERLAKAAEWESYDRRTRSWRSCLPPDVATAAVLARGEWRGMRPLDTVSEAPFFRTDGGIVQDPGYDATSRCLYAPSMSFPRVPDQPSAADAAASLEVLLEPFADFPFRGDADRMVPIAAILSLLARPAIDGPVPALLFDASMPGSGKSLLADCVSTIATGRPAPRCSWPADEVELDKVLSSNGLRGANLMTFDNITTPIVGGPLDKALTSVDLDMRILGRSEMVSLPWRTVVLMTGNNLQVQGDTQRRVIIARLEPQVENPQERTDFVHQSLILWLREHRGNLVRAALMILRAYHLVRRPAIPGLTTWGSYEAWAALIPTAIAWAGGANVLDARLTAQGADDPHRGALRAILAAWPRLDPSGRGMTCRALVSLLYPSDRSHEEGPPDGYDDLREALETVAGNRNGKGVDTKALGKAFRRWRGVICGGQRIECQAGQGGIMRWVVV